jgi:phosphate transport system substrate-binding protein
MKNLLFILMLSAMLMAGCGQGNHGKDQIKTGGDTSALAGTINIAGTRILHPMVMIWAQEFKKANPKVNILVNDMPSSDAMKKLAAGSVELALISRPLSQEEVAGAYWSAPVALDAMVPVISFDNAFIQPIVMNGLTKDKLRDVFTGKVKSWGQLVSRKTNDPVKVYIQTDSSDLSNDWAAFLNISPTDLKGSAQITDAQVMSTLAEDENGISYCSILSLYERITGKRNEGIYIVPTDLNNNGVVDDKEQYYDDFGMITKALGAGKLPSPPARTFYIVAKTKPAGPLLKEFVKWVLTIGQNYMPRSGYINIQADKAAVALGTLN